MFAKMGAVATRPLTTLQETSVLKSFAAIFNGRSKLLQERRGGRFGGLIARHHSNYR